MDDSIQVFRVTLVLLKGSEMFLSRGKKDHSHSQAYFLMISFSLKAFSRPYLGYHLYFAMQLPRLMHHNDMCSIHKKSNLPTQISLKLVSRPYLKYSFELYLVS